MSISNRADNGNPEVKLELKQTVETDEVNNLYYIYKFGQLLGKGDFGVAIRINDKVYKIYGVTYLEEEKSYGKIHCNDPKLDAEKSNTEKEFAERSARYWNEIYSKIYNGKYKKYATAKYKEINGRHVLITPFISGRHPTGCFCYCYEGSKKLSAELKKISFDAADLWNSDNVIIKDTTGDPVPVDFDMFFRIPQKKFFCFYSYPASEPPSPRSLSFAREKHCFVFRS